MGMVIRKQQNTATGAEFMIKANLPIETKNRNALRKIEILKYAISYNSIMIEELLDTKAKVRIMKFLSEFPDEQFQAIDVAGRLKLSVSRTSECLKDLAGNRILQSRKIGKGYLFKVNSSNYLTRIILDAFRKEKRVVELIADDFVSRAKRLGGVKSIVLFGSALKGPKIGSDIDFLVVSEGEIDKSKISKITAELDVKYGFTVSSLAMTMAEFKKKAKAGESFVINVMATHKLFYGTQLEELVYGKGS